MSMFVKKTAWQIIQEKQNTVNRARKNCRDCAKGFQCFCSDDLLYPETEDDVIKRVVIDNDGAAHIVQNVAMPMRCLIFHEDNKCTKASCPHIDWNTKSVELYLTLKNARYERNLAIWNLFGLQKRVIDIQAYRKLKLEKRAKSKEVFGLCCECACAEGDTQVQMQEKYESALQEYDKLVAKCKVARRKAFGCGK